MTVPSTKPMTHILLPISGIHFDTDNLPNLRFSRNDADELSVVFAKLDQKEQLLEGKDADVLWEALYLDKPKTDAPKRSSNWMSALVGSHKKSERRQQ
jgi:hypothetical protein